MDQLTASLLDLLHVLEGRSIPLTVGGGFGLYLKRQHLASTGQRTLFDQMPEPRATNDLDLFVRTEVLADHGRTEQIRAAIVRLGYTPVPTAKFMQWVKQVSVNGVPQPLKIDLLVGPLGARATDLHADERRARPKQKIEFHARRTEGAISIEEEPIVVMVAGKRSTGEPFRLAQEALGLDILGPLGSLQHFPQPGEGGLSLLFLAELVLRHGQERQVFQEGFLPEPVRAPECVEGLLVVSHAIVRYPKRVEIGIVQGQAASGLGLT
jgi:hypothetical protein